MKVWGTCMVFLDIRAQSKDGYSWGKPKLPNSPPCFVPGPARPDLIMICYTKLPRGEYGLVKFDSRRSLPITP